MTVRDLLDLCGGFFLGLIVAWVSMGSVKAHISDEVNKLRVDVARHSLTKLAKRSPRARPLNGSKQFFQCEPVLAGNALNGPEPVSAELPGVQPATVQN